MTNRTTISTLARQGAAAKWAKITEPEARRLATRAALLARKRRDKRVWADKMAALSPQEREEATRKRAKRAKYNKQYNQRVRGAM